MPTMIDLTRHPSSALGMMPGLALSGVAALVFLCACESTEQAAVESSAPAMSAHEPDYNERIADRVEAEYVIGPAAARELNYRIDWQQPRIGPNVRRIEVDDDSVFVLDSSNFMARLDRDGGDRIWRLPIAEPVLEVLGITYRPTEERVYVTAAGEIMEIDSINGLQVGKQRLQKIANTEPIVFDQFFIYGSRNGQLIWHAYRVGAQWRGYQISGSILVPPIYSDGTVVTVGFDGTIMALDAASARRNWTITLLDRVLAAPAVHDDVVYIAGLDQHLWAYNLLTGRNEWRYLTESPLRNAPVAIGDQVFLQIPSEGLVAFEARPADAPGGIVNWKASEVTGNVIAARKGVLMVWDAENREMTLLSEKRGSHIKTISLPKVHTLLADSLDGDELYAASADGRISRLVPRN